MLNFQLVTIILNTVETMTQVLHLVEAQKENFAQNNGRFFKWSSMNDLSRF